MIRIASAASKPAQPVSMAHALLPVLRPTTVRMAMAVSTANARRPRPELRPGLSASMLRSAVRLLARMASPQVRPAAISKSGARRSQSTRRSIRPSIAVAVLSCATRKVSAPLQSARLIAIAKPAAIAAQRASAFLGVTQKTPARPMSAADLTASATTSARLTATALTLRFA